MKQYTTPEQTAKLIELGFEKPKNSLPIREENKALVYQLRYTIGELIELLDGVSELEITRYGSGWEVGDELRAFTGEELIDSLFDMIVILKGDGVI